MIGCDRCLLVGEVGEVAIRERVVVGAGVVESGKRRCGGRRVERGRES